LTASGSGASLEAVAAPNLEQLLASRTDSLCDALDRPRWRPRGRPWDAELRKVLCGLVGAMADARRLHALGGLDDAGRRRISDILDCVSPTMSLDVALEAIDALEAALVDYGDETYVHSRLRSEHQRSPSGRPGRRSTTALSWADVLDENEVRELLEPRRWTEGDLAHARRLLAALARAQTADYRLQRARSRMRALYLLGLGPVLFVLVGGLAYAIQLVVPAEKEVIVVVALAGAVGSTLSGVYKLRDGVRRISQLRAFLPSMVAQPLVGAAAGLVLFLVLEAGFRGEGGGVEWPMQALLAFVAGFSEPFFLGVVRSVADLGEPRTAGARPAAEPAPAEPSVPPAG
jgi:hypothetical protein